MFDFSFISIIISISALLLSLYRELKGPDISLLSEPTLKLTDEFFHVSDENIPQWLNFSEVSLVFANYGGKGGTIVDVKIDFTPSETFNEFFQDFSFYPSDLPITIKDGENYTMKFKPYMRTINWKKFGLTKTLQSDQKVEEIVDKAIAEGKGRFERFCSFLSENEELGEISCTVRLTIGRLWTKIKDKKFFEKIKVKNEYDKTIDLLRKRLQNWDHLQPTRLELIDEFLRAPKDLRSELEKNLIVLENEANGKNITQLKIDKSRWDNLSRARDDVSRTRWFLIDREKNLRKDLEGLYERISNYNTRIRELSYLRESRIKTDFDNLNKDRVTLYKDIERMCDRLKGLLQEFHD